MSVSRKGPSADREASIIARSMIRLGLGLLIRVVEAEETSRPSGLHLQEHADAIRTGLRATEEMIRARQASDHFDTIKVNYFQQLLEAAELGGLIEACLVAKNSPVASSEDKTRAAAELEALLRYADGLPSQIPYPSARTRALAEYADWGDPRVLGAVEPDDQD